MPIQLTLVGKSALITGGASGIGRAMAHVFRALGANVIVTGVSEQEVQSAAADPALVGIELRVLDVTDADQVTRLFDRLAGLDILVNAAGIGSQGPAEFALASFERTLDINLSGSMRTCVAARPLLESGGGTIINVASVMSFLGSAASPAYCSSKGGVAQLTRSLALAWSAAGIRVNAVAPGWIDTPMTVALKGDTEKNGKWMAHSAMKRCGQPEEVAAGIAFLCSPLTSFITGIIMPIDGGCLAS